MTSNTVVAVYSDIFTYSVDSLLKQIIEVRVRELKQLQYWTHRTCSIGSKYDGPISVRLALYHWSGESKTAFPLSLILSRWSLACEINRDQSQLQGDPKALVSYYDWMGGNISSQCSRLHCRSNEQYQSRLSNGISSHYLTNIKLLARLCSYTTCVKLSLSFGRSLSKLSDFSVEVARPCLGCYVISVLE